MKTRENNRPLNKFFTTSSLEKGKTKIDYSSIERVGCERLRRINNIIIELKEKKNNIIDRYIEGLKRNISKKKEFQLNIELQETEKNITRKLKDKEKLLLKIIKTI